MGVSNRNRLIYCDSHIKTAILCNMFFKVRAAAVFALGRFIANTGDRSDQANQIDFGVAVTLTQMSLDGSPLVRKVSGATN